MIPPKTLNILRSSLRSPQVIKRFRDCPTLATLPYATYGNAHQITLAAEILGAALYWRADRFRRLKRSSAVRSKPIGSVAGSAPSQNNLKDIPQHQHNPQPPQTLVEPSGEE